MRSAKPFEVGRFIYCSLSFFYFLNFFEKKVYFFMPKFWYIKKLLYLCHTIKHRIINL